MPAFVCVCLFVYVLFVCLTCCMSVYVVCVFVVCLYVCVVFVCVHMCVSVRACV